MSLHSYVVFIKPMSATDKCPVFEIPVKIDLTWRTGAQMKTWAHSQTATAENYQITLLLACQIQEPSLSLHSKTPLILNTITPDLKTMKTGPPYPHSVANVTQQATGHLRNVEVLTPDINVPRNATQLQAPAFEDSGPSDTATQCDLAAYN